MKKRTLFNTNVMPDKVDRKRCSKEFHALPCHDRIILFLIISYVTQSVHNYDDALFLCLNVSCS